MNDGHTAGELRLRIEKGTLAEFKPLPQGEDQYPLEYIEANSAIKLRENEETLFVGICEPSNQRLVENLKNFHQKKIRFFEIDKSELAGYLSERFSILDTREAGAAAAADERLLLDQLANDAPIINLVNSIFIEAIRQGASDIHLECFSEQMVVRYRLDGYLHTVNRIDKEKFPGVSTRIKIMANLNIMERRLPQDGRITVHLGGDMLDMRVSIVPIARGESIVLRLFSMKKAPLTLEQLGLAEEQMGPVLALADLPSGLVLVSGPTGSGKTTSLNAVLQQINSDTQKIITIEDPIEYVIEGVSQIQTNDRIGLSFDTILRRVLRQDPNIIMVGEIRDAETAELAVRAALTGHLVFSTLHTRDSVSVITRLANMGVEAYLIAAVLRGSIAQRLVRKVCPQCRHKVKPQAAEKKLLERFQLPAGGLFKGKGCKACHNSGYRGRIGLFELFAGDERIEEMIADRVRETEIRRYLEGRGMKPLLLDGLEKAVAGVTTIAEIERAVSG